MGRLLDGPNPPDAAFCFTDFLALGAYRAVTDRGLVPGRDAGIVGYDDTWDRSGLANRNVFQKQTRADLIRRRIPFITLRGSLEERLKTVIRVLERFDKYSSIADNLITTSCRTV